MKSVVIIGASGQLGGELVKLLSERAKLYSFSHKDMEICNFEKVNSLIKQIKPEIVINASAFNKVDLCETEVNLAFNVNAFAVRNLAKVCQQLKIMLIHFSTDYVFGGERNYPYHEADRPNPLSVYACSKLAGEYFVSSVCEKHLIIRTCGLYTKTERYNFVNLMLKLVKENKPIRVVCDQYVTPTSANELAKKVIQLLEMCKENEHAFGLYHITNNGECTWYEFAKKIFEVAKLRPNLQPVSSEQFGARARRPKYSVLENRRLKILGIDDLRQWQDALEDHLRRLLF
jgi:dTDP-4-dehydrorhamnose reductase